jgi:hypothetical protein
VAIAGGALGLAVGYAGMMLFSQIRIPSDLPIMIAFDMDQRALVFGLVLAICAFNGGASNLNPIRDDVADRPRHAAEPPCTIHAPLHRGRLDL